MMLDRIRDWWAGRKLDAMEKKHAEWCAHSLVIIAAKDPDRATRLWTRLRAMNDNLATVPSSELLQAHIDTRVAQIELLMRELELEM